MSGGVQPNPRSTGFEEQYEDAKPTPRQDSGRSSRLGSFIEDEPTFESQGSSDSDSEVLPERPSKFPVSVVWQNISVEESRFSPFGSNKVLTLNKVSGYAVPRSVLAIVGPAKSGKSALVNVIGDRLQGRAVVHGNLAYNGKSLKESRVVPTFLCATDEPLANVTVEQALIYTALLQMPDSGNGELEAEVRRICERLGLLTDLSRTTNGLDLGTKRRLAVACQLINSTSLLVLHDVLLGIQEGDALAIMRTVHQATKEGCTAIVVCQQPTTDICSFFSSAYILVSGEVVYFGDTGAQAVDLLMSAGMPCPPLYSPVEQYMRLVDPSFEVYLQAQGNAATADDWNARFSSMMFKVLQGSYQASPLAADANSRALALAGASYDPVDDHKRRISAGAQCFVLCRRLVTQGLQGLPLYLGRIIFSVIISFVYGGTYWKLNRSFLGAQERAVVLFIVAAVLPALAIGTLPFYTNGTNVLLRERRRCRLGIGTHFAALFTLTLPHLAAAAIFAAIILLPMTSLNTTSAGWGYFILNSTLGQLCSDSMMLFLATTVPPFLQTMVALGLLLIQALASGFFPGANRGFNLPVSTVSFTSWSYKGLLKNEFEYRPATPWGCPAESILPRLFQGPCLLDNREVYAALSNGTALLPKSRWDAIYVLLGIYAFWTIAYLVAVWARSRQRSLPLSATLDRGAAAEQAVIIDNPLHSGQSFGNPLHSNQCNNNPLLSNQSQGGEPVNGIAARMDSPV